MLDSQKLINYDFPVFRPRLWVDLTEQFRHSLALVCEDVITLEEVRITGVDWTLRSEAKAMIE